MSRNPLALESHVCDAVRWVMIVQALLVNMGEAHMDVLQTPEGLHAFMERLDEVRLATNQVQVDVEAIKTLFFRDDK